MINYMLLIKTVYRNNSNLIKKINYLSNIISIVFVYSYSICKNVLGFLNNPHHLKTRSNGFCSAKGDYIAWLS